HRLQQGKIMYQGIQAPGLDQFSTESHDEGASAMGVHVRCNFPQPGYKLCVRVKVRLGEGRGRVIVHGVVGKSILRAPDFSLEPRRSIACKPLPKTMVPRPRACRSPSTRNCRSVAGATRSARRSTCTRWSLCAGKPVR